MLNSIGNVGKQIIGIRGNQIQQTLLSRVQALFTVPGSQGVLYDSSVISSLFTDTNGTIPVSAPGQLVARQNDLSGLGYHSTQSITTSRPTYQTENGYHYLNVDGSNDGMFTNSISWGTDEMEFVSCLRKNTDSTPGMFMEFSGNSSINNGVWGIHAPFTANQNQYVAESRGTVLATATYTNPSVAAPNLCVLGARRKVTTDVLVLSINGVDVITQNSNQGNNIISTTGIFRYRRGGSSLPFNGRDYRTFVINRILTVEERNLVLQWAAEGAGLII